jgi:predicted helicase
MKFYLHQQNILDSLKKYKRGLITCPTGGGKTVTFIHDSRRFLIPGGVVVVVAPQLMLSEQLFKEFDKHLPDVDFYYRQVSSEKITFQRDRKNLNFRITPPKSPTTIVDEIQDTYRIAQKLQKPLILFVTYASLGRIVSADIPVSAVYYDEAHNATASDNFNAVKGISEKAKHNYFFTATPRYTQSHSVSGAGMDNTGVYGEHIANVKFRELVQQGIIVSPWIHLLKSNAQSRNLDEVSVDIDSIMETVNYYEKEHSDTGAHKILVACRGAKSIQDIRKSMMKWANGKGYDLLSVDYANGGFINDQKICSGSDKGKFLQKLNELGQDLTQKMIVLHYDMLGEGIDVKAFTGTVFIRNILSNIKAVQAIGRVIRKSPGKKYGIVTVIQHEDDTDDAQQLIRKIVNQLKIQGVPVSEIFSEVSGRGKDNEIVEDLDNELLKRMIKNYDIEFENFMLEKFIAEEAEKTPVDQIVL